MRRTYTLCKECKWWNKLEESGGKKVARGECRRYPPSIFFAGLVYHTYCEVSKRGWPIVQADFWCGEAHF